MAALAAFALTLAFLIQNIEEMRAGGPPVPPVLHRFSYCGRHQAQRQAMIFVSVLVPLLLTAAMLLGWAWGATMIAAALAANALGQLGRSLWRRRLLPGTVTGTLLMLPAAIWLLVEIGSYPGKIIWAALGVIAMPPMLMQIWFLALRSDRGG